MSNHGVLAAPLLSPAHQPAGITDSFVAADATSTSLAPDVATLFTVCCEAGDSIYDSFVALALDANGTSEITCALDQLHASHDLFTVTPVDLSVVPMT